jgi:hypothetical protein
MTAAPTGLQKGTGGHVLFAIGTVVALTKHH